ncbi:hypothetical protein C8R45DRAFT_1103274 [Mycena sanguinolenta]|nr:hypothetical protein C8R45DRAFT_1103274 [Mycena sanguinolenta]
MADNDDFSLCPAVDGCGSNFPNKTISGPCQRCKTLEAATAQEKAKIENLPQCLECGVIGKNISNEKCVTCIRKEKNQVATASQASQVKTAATLARPGAWAARMTSNQAQMSSSATQVVKRPVNSRTRYITVCIEALHIGTSKSVGWLGANSRAFPDSTMFGDAVSELLQAYNTSFETRSVASLTARDVTIRWHGNLGFHQNSDCGTIGEFYDIHFRLHNSETFLRMPVKFKTATQPAVALALFIDPIKFKQNHGIDPPLNDREHLKAKGKRRLSDDFDEPAPKRVALSKPLTSRYVPMVSVVAAVPPFCTVDLKIEQVRNPETKSASDPAFPWPGQSKLTARLYNDAMFTGKDKAVFKMEIGSDVYVAKRYHEICTDVESFIQNYRHLKNNVVWLWLTSRAFEVQPVFLAVEDLENTEPSVASGVTTKVLQDAQLMFDTAEKGTFSSDHRPRILWLIQRYNGKTQDRWNLMKPQNLTPNKIDATVLGFTHFYWQVFGPERSGVLSHYQIMPGRMANGSYGKLIFDVVAQNDTKMKTNPRYTDDGEQGAQMVKESHRCNRVCELFNLDPAAGAGEEEQDEDDEEEQEGHETS